MVIYQTELCDLRNKKYAHFFENLLKVCMKGGDKYLDNSLEAKQSGTSLLEEKTKNASSNSRSP